MGIWGGGEEGRSCGEPQRALSIGKMWTEPCGLRLMWTGVEDPVSAGSPWRAA